MLGTGAHVHPCSAVKLQPPAVFVFKYEFSSGCFLLACEDSVLVCVYAKEAQKEHTRITTGEESPRSVPLLGAVP